MSKPHSPLGRAFGRYFANRNGLKSILLPEGVGAEVSVSIVSAINQITDRTDGLPRAMRTGSTLDGGPGSESDYAAVGLDDVMENRHDDRIIVTDSSSALVIETITTVFDPVVRPDFPDGIELDLNAASEITFLGLAEAAFEDLQAGLLADADISSETYRRLVTSLAECMRFLKTVYGEFSGQFGSWNLAWFAHVDSALRVLEAAIRSGSPIDFAGASNVVFASMGLPQPDAGFAYARRNDSSRYIELVKDRWTDEAEISIEIQRMSSSGSQVRLDQLNWAGISSFVLGSLQNPVLRLVAQDQSSPEYIDAWSSVTESHFFGSLTEESSTLRIFRVDPTGALVETSGTLLSGGVSVVPVGPVAAESVASGELSVLVSLAHRGLSVDEARSALEASSFGISVGGNTGLEFEISERFVSDGGVEVRGRFVRVSESRQMKFSRKPTKLGLNIASTDSFRPFVDKNATVQCIFVPANLGNLICEVFRGSKSKKPELLPPWVFNVGKGGILEPIPEDRDDDEENRYAINVELAHQVRLFSPDCEITGVGSAVSGLAGGWARTVGSAFDGGVVSCGELRYSVDWEDQDSQSTLSPLVAALLGSQPSLEPLPPVAADSLRGVVEEEYRRRASEDSPGHSELLDSLGHVLLPSYQQLQVSDLVPSSTRNFLIPQGLDFVWDGPLSTKIPTNLLESDALEGFRAAIKALGLGSILTFDRGAGVDPAVVSPSQARLTNREFEPDVGERIENYLLAYSRLIEAAKEDASSGPNGRVGVFWASYPFTISVWSKAPIPTCRAVMLSPLHPLRISWLFGVEQSFRHATEDLRKSLAGIVEGWNIPFLGPANDAGRMMALPTDNGPGQVFLGWSLMTRVGLDSPYELGPPEFAGNLRLPGSSSSGISRRGVSHAIRDYRSVYPHVSTLTIDVASSQQAPRMPELDDAVIAETSGVRSSFFGGVRVLDSLNRSGSIPDVSSLQKIDGDEIPKPLVWKRYDPNAGGAPASEVDLRILQDPGAVTWLEVVGDEDSETPAGVLGPVPFRRLEVHGRSGAAADGAKIIPSVGPESMSAFGLALAGLERNADGANFRVISHFPVNYFGDSSPKWTVSGEASFRPGAIPDLLPEGSEERMLWEWSPSFLEARSVSVPELDSRPYISITRVSGALRAQLKDRLSRIEDFPAAGSDESVRWVLQTLGVRGVGLSRLLAGKDERTVGAIGFALSLELAGQNRAGYLPESGLAEFWDFVFPIDVCWQYLRGMSGDGIEGITRRADLLIFRLFRDGTIRIVPVEIKVRGLHAPVLVFPTESDADLQGAREQLEQSLEVLDSIRTRFERLDVTTPQGEADRYLMSTALAALIDAAIGLCSHVIDDQEGLRSALYGVASGQGGLELGRPVVVFIGNGNRDGEAGFVERRDLALQWIASSGPSEYAQFLVNAGRLATELQSDEQEIGEIQSAWRDLVEWCFAGDSIPRAVISPPTDRPDEDSIESERSSIRGDEETTTATAVTVSSSSETDTEVQLPTDAVAPIQGDGIRFTVGSLSGVSIEKTVDYWPSNTALSQLNIGVVGDLGTGKTELVKSLVYQIRSMAKRQGQPVSFLILDYKGDYKGSDFLASVDGYAVGHEPIPLNLFELSGEYSDRAAWRKARQFVDVIKRIYRDVGPVQSERLEKSITALFKEGGGVEPTLQEVADRYREETGQADSVTGILSVFTQGGWFSSDRSKTKKFSEMLGDKVLVVSLDDAEMDDLSKTAVAALFLNLYRQYMLDRKMWPFEGNDPQLRRLNSFVLVDEAHNVMKLNIAALQEILLQGRQFGIGVILSSQFLSHFKNSDVDYRQPLLTWFIHKVPALRVQELRDLGITIANEGLVSEIQNLPVSSSLYKSLGVEGRVIREIPYWRLIQGHRDE